MCSFCAVSRVAFEARCVADGLPIYSFDMLRQSGSSGCFVLDTVNMAGTEPFVVDAGTTRRIFGATFSSGARAFENYGTLELQSVAVRDFRGAPGIVSGAVFNQGALFACNSTFSGNRISDDSTADSKGGGIANVGTLEVCHSIFTDNVATDYGGAIFNHGTATFASVRFERNRCNFFGGAISNGGQWAAHARAPPWSSDVARARIAPSAPLAPPNASSRTTQ
jgi:predicted outer membrane repeat protein